MRAHFRHLRSKIFSMVLRALQFIEIWPFNSPSEVLEVHRDSLSQIGSCLGNVRAHSLTLSYTFSHSRECVVTPGLPLGPHPSNAFAFAPGLPSFWACNLAMPLPRFPSFLPLGLQPCNPFALVASPKLGLRQMITVHTMKTTWKIIFSSFIHGWEHSTCCALEHNLQK
jgi:hypothetical protein